MNAARAIHQEMVARGFRRDRKAVATLRFTGHLAVRGRDITVAVTFEGRELTRVPKLQLLNRAGELPGIVAHIEANDRFCYVRQEELQLDPEDPKGAVVLCLGLMEAALARSTASDLRSDIAREFPQHWLGGSIFVDLPEDYSGGAWLYSLPQGREVIVTSKAALRRLGHLPSERDPAPPRNRVLVAAIGEELTFSAGQRAPDTFGALLDWLRPIAPAVAEALVESLPTTWPELPLFMLHAPNGTVGGRLALPMVMQRSVTRPQFLRRMLRHRSHEIGLTRWTGARIDAEFILRRNMHQQLDLSGKRVALLGVGTIGGFLARFLAQSGAGMNGGELVLFDEQPLTAGNLGRHYLGLGYVGVGKAKAMKDELSRVAPDCSVRIVDGDALEHVDDFLKFDLVIDATGDRAVSDVLNHTAVRARRMVADVPTVLHVWLVGSGVAAQALLVDGAEHACYRCLRLKKPGEERFPVLRDDHDAALIPANCGEGSYFAYGVGAPAVAAGLAIQMCLDWAKGTPSPRFRTVRVVHEATKQVKDQNPGNLADCPACAAA